MTTVFEALGGEAAIDQAVDRFYDRVLQDDRIKHFFAEMDMDRQKEHQRAFLTYALGGADQYTGRSMRQAHESLVDLGLNETHFDAVAEDLMATLGEMGVPPELQAQVAAIVGDPQHKKDVLNQ